MPRTIKTPGDVPEQQPETAQIVDPAPEQQPEQQPETVPESIATGRPVLTAEGWVV